MKDLTAGSGVATWPVGQQNMANAPMNAEALVQDIFHYINPLDPRVGCKARVLSWRWPMPMAAVHLQQVATRPNAVQPGGPVVDEVPACGCSPARLLKPGDPV